MSSIVINNIPYGSKIYAIKTKYKSTYNGKTDNWYKLAGDIKGYIFGYYLSQIQKFEKKFRLFKHATGYEHYYGAELILYNGIALKIEKVNIYYPEVNIYKGDYWLLPDGIRIRFKKKFSQKYWYKSKLNNISPIKGKYKITKVVIKNYNFFDIYWNNKAGGFLEKKDFYYLNSMFYKLNKKKAQFVDLVHRGDARYSPGYFSIKNPIKWIFSKKAKLFMK